MFLIKYYGLTVPGASDGAMLRLPQPREYTFKDWFVLPGSNPPPTPCQRLLDPLAERHPASMVSGWRSLPRHGGLFGRSAQTIPLLSSTVLEFKGERPALAAVGNWLRDRKDKVFGDLRHHTRQAPAAALGHQEASGLVFCGRSVGSSSDHLQR